MTMVPKPTKPCYCGANDWWLTPDGRYLCGRCHPNPNKEAEVITNKGKCSHGEFILSEGCPQCIAERRQASIRPEQNTEGGYSPEVLALRDRVRLGNKKLFDAWQQLKEIFDDKEQWTEGLERWGQANEKLSLLCTQLMALGYMDCLYLDETGKKIKKCLPLGDDLGCRVCPSSRKYSEEELMEL